MSEKNTQDALAPAPADAPEVRRSNEKDIQPVGRVDTGANEDIDKLEAGAETYAAILAKNKPDPLGKGYIRLYLLSAAVFLCSTMNGASDAVNQRERGR